MKSTSGDDNQTDWAIPRQSTPLGHPLPLDEHACSVSLPTWQSVVGYEEGWKSITSQLKCGYPRFVYHPYVIQLMDRALELDQTLQQQQQQLTHSSSSRENSTDESFSSEKVFDCIVLPSRDSAIRCHDFLIKACGFCAGYASSPRFAKNYQGSIMTTIDLFCPDNALDWISDPPQSSPKEDSSVDPWYNPNAPIRMLNLHAAGTFAVIFPAQTAFALEAKSYWQHSGEIVSSRRAECALMELNQGVESSSFSLQRLTSCYYDDSNPQSESFSNNTDKMNWKSCPNNPNLKYMVQHPSIVQGDEKNNKTSKTTFQSYDHIRNHIADVTFTAPSCVFLTPSGMASIYTALRSARRRKLFMPRQEEEGSNVFYNESNLPTKKRGNGGGTAIVYGFPYLDTLKMCSRTEWVPGGVEFFGFADDQDLDQLSQWLYHRRTAQQQSGGDDGKNVGVSILLTEYPSNPLLKCPDLKALRALADEYDFALVVDDTIGNFANLDLLSSGLADAVCTSLTKLFSGRGDVIAGSIVTNPNTSIGRWMQQDLLRIENRMKRLKETGTMLFMGDAAALQANAKNFLERSDKINQTAEAFADWLKERDEIAKVYYPKYSCGEKYQDALNTRPLPILVEEPDSGKARLRFHKAGYGGLMSIILQPNICQRTFYDSLNISKGPSLGTNFTLVCPYTLLAHYHELDFAMSYNVEPNLLRISVGLEDLDELKEKFSFAFQSSRLYPKVPPLKKQGLGENGNRRLFSTWSDHRLEQAYTFQGSKQKSWRTDQQLANIATWNGLNGITQYTCVGNRNFSKRLIGRCLNQALRLLH